MRRVLVFGASSVLLLISACSAPVGPCSPSTCATGCCDAAGVCELGNLTSACGSGGLACNACSTGLVCQANACVIPGATGGGTGTGGGTASGGGTATGGGSGSTMVGTFTVSGRATYDFVPISYDVPSDTGTLNFAGATQRPVRGATVRVLEGTQVLASGQTALDGAYTLTFTSTGSAPLTVQLLAKTGGPAITVQDNTDGDAVWAIAAGVPMGGGTLDLRATHGWTGSAYGSARRAGPFAILDSMYTATTAFLVARPSLVFPALKVNWSPNNTTDVNGSVADGFLGSSYFDPEVNQIFVVGKDGVDTDEYDAHVIVHEWGHYFEANLARSDSLGGDHTLGDTLDPRDSFSEGWGDAASAMLLDDPIYADTYFEAGAINAFGWDTENEPTPTDDPNPGVFSETSVMRLLYDAWDPANEGSFDRLDGLGTITDAFRALRTTDALCTIGSFITAYKAQPGVSAAAVDAMLAHYSMGPITTDYGDGDAALRGMYSTVSAFPFSGQATLDGTAGYNFAGQNKYWIFTGNGAQLTVSATSTKDVGITAYKRGTFAGFADDLSTGGTETFRFTSVNGAIYILDLTGYGANNAPYTASVSITSP